MESDSFPVSNCDQSSLRHENENQYFTAKTVAPTKSISLGFHEFWAYRLGATLFNDFIRLFKFYARRLYEISWHEMSLDPRVRPSPWSPSIEDEVKLTLREKIRIRVGRLYFLAIHILAFIGLYHCLTGKVYRSTIIWAVLFANLNFIGVNGGSHRFWAHNSYKAKWPVRLFLTLLHTAAFQFSVLFWVRVHRAHHKYVDTDGDPHNARRGFFFSHIGWLLVFPHPDAARARMTSNTRDIESDWVIKYNHKFFPVLGTLFCYVIPTLIPWYFWGEDLWLSHLVSGHLRHVYVLHGTFLVNSAAHKWGTRPYDKSICSTENIICSIITGGEGWHNFHHASPWDYRSAELGGFMKYTMNMQTTFIELCARMGLVYDLKTVPAEMVIKRQNRTGKESHQHHQKSKVWGWNDEDLREAERTVTLITNEKVMRAR